ncbi:MAG: FAD-binding protein [Candidatus Bathyarchaeia archaeon]
MNYEKVNEVETDVLIIGGGISGSWAATEAAKRGVRVAVAEVMDVFSAGPAGVDHWHDAFDNPACKYNPDQAIEINERAWLEGLHIFPLNPIVRYITYNNSYKTLLELEKLGAKIRDDEDEFKGAPFRDEETKLLYAYNYDVKHTIRVWGQTFRQALYGELVRLRVPLYSRVLVTSLLTENGEVGGRVVGAVGVHTRTGELYVFKSKATILCTGGRDVSNRIFNYFGYGFYSLHSPSMVGMGHVMAWNAGAELEAPDRVIRIRIGFGHGTMPSYATGNPSNTWYPCRMVDADGKEIPWFDPVTKREFPYDYEYLIFAGRRGYEMASGAYHIQPISHNPYTAREFMERVRRGEFKLPLYADLPSMPENERRVIFGLMVAAEGKTWIVYRNLTQAGFDPNKDLLQGYTAGWTGLDPFDQNYMSSWSGIMHDWDLKTNLEGLYVAGDATFGGVAEHAGAAVTGRWAGAKAAEYAKSVSFGSVSWDQVERERERIYAPTKRNEGIDWRELNVAISTVMRTYVNPDLTNDEMLRIALKWLEEMEHGEANKLVARNPHELTRCLETLAILENAKLTVISMMESRKRPGLKPYQLVVRKTTEGIKFVVRPWRWWLLPPYAPTYRENYERHKPW